MKCPRSQEVRRALSIASLAWYCIVFYFMVLHGITWCCTVLYGTPANYPVVHLGLFLKLAIFVVFWLFIVWSQDIKRNWTQISRRKTFFEPQFPAGGILQQQILTSKAYCVRLKPQSKSLVASINLVNLFMAGCVKHEDMQTSMSIDLVSGGSSKVEIVKRC